MISLVSISGEFEEYRRILFLIVYKIRFERMDTALVAMSSIMVGGVQNHETPREPTNGSTARD